MTHQQKNPSLYSDEWFAEAETFHERRAQHYQRMKDTGLWDKNRRFLFQDDLDAESGLAQQARDRTLKSVIAELRNPTHHLNQ